MYSYMKNEFPSGRFSCFIKIKITILINTRHFNNCTLAGDINDPVTAPGQDATR